jgi:photosystem II stability/assembly factor-like uncharacterized protein
MNDDRRHDSSQFGDLEVRLRDHYEELGRTSSIVLTRRIGAELDRRSNRRPAFSLPIGRIHSDNGTVTPRDAEAARRPRAGLQAGPALWGALRVATTVAAAIALLAVLVLPRLTGPTAGPTFDPGAAEKATVAAAGRMQDGGIWVSTGPYILTSTDNGASWRAMPAPDGTPYVLDSVHAWTLRWADPPGDGSTSSNLNVARTSDGGRTWRNATVSASSPCSPQTLWFLDASRGFLICGTNDGANVLRTVDGGATWQGMGESAGLGRSFTASDADTLWSARDSLDPSSAQYHDGIVLSVSRDAGASWSVVDLPELASLSAAKSESYPKAAIAGGPTFVDATHGAFAIWDLRNQDAVDLWIYRTADVGRTWTLEKSSGHRFRRQVDVGLGRIWTIVSGSTTTELSSDSGATWSETPGIGLPEDGQASWVDFTDRDHGVALVDYKLDQQPLNTNGYLIMRGPLMLSSDGGRTWRAADFGSSRAAVPASEALDPAAAQQTAYNFEYMARHEMPAGYQDSASTGAWRLLSPYSQLAFGTYGAFVAAQPLVTVNPVAGDASRGSDVLNAGRLGADLWQDLTEHADMARAYVVEVAFPGSSVAPETLVVAPLSSTGEWRVWVVMK